MTPQVELRAHDTRWLSAGAAECERVREALGAESVEHIGSTAVPGLAAKPIVDLLAGLTSLDLEEERVAAMEVLGYEYLGEFGLPGRLYFRKGEPRTHHVHAVELGGEHWLRHLAVRDFLRADPAEVERYEREKRRAADASGGNWERYGDEKAAYVSTLERRALAWHAGEDGSR